MVVLKVVFPSAILLLCGWDEFQQVPNAFKSYCELWCLV